MDAVTWERAKDLITEVLKRSPAERAAILRDRCPDPALRAEIEAMLRAYEKDPDFLEQPPAVGEEVDEFADLQPGTRVGPYVIVDRLGRGGMGQVFLSSDPRLHRKVALKCLLTSRIVDQGGDDRRRRILREARAAAAISHPNVATIYDVIEHDNRAFIVMEYVEGESLAARLKRERLSIPAILSIGRQLAAAVAAAHATGVIHRDLKPGNVQLLPDGTVKVLDFGVAKASALASSSAFTTERKTQGATQGGYVLVGTVGYMSPEQMLGREVDERSDIFSLGVVLYEMTTGRRPFTKSDLLDLVVTMAKRPPRVDADDPRVPAALADVIGKALQIDAADRFQSVVELEAAMSAIEAPSPEPHPQAAPVWSSPRRMWALFAAAAAIVLLVLVARPFRRGGAEPPAGPAQRVVAVLPLENLSGDPSKQYLGAGVAETLTMALSKVNTATVISRAEVQEAIRTTREPRKVAQDLHASVLVDGSVQQAGDDVLITLRIVEPNGKQGWSDSYSGKAADIFALHRRMAADLVREVQGGDVVRADLTVPPTSNVDALTAYWQGRAMLERAVAPPEFDEAIALFAKSVALDPDFALGYAGQADAYWRYYQVSRDQTLPRKALEAGLKAKGLDANQPAVRVSVAAIYQGMGQYDDAIEELRKALELQPSNDDVHRTMAQVLGAQGKSDDAVRELNEAIRIRPNHWVNYYELGRQYYRLRRLDAAAAAWQRANELRPNDVRLVGNLGAVYAQMWDNARALDYFERANKLSPSERGFVNICDVYQRLGRLDDAVTACLEAIRLNPRLEVAHYNLGDAYARRGNKADARREIEKARELWTAALRLNEKDAFTMARIAVCEAKLDMRAQAERRASAAAALAPKDPEVQYKRAVVAALAGRQDEALGALRLAIDLGINRREAREDRDLASLRNLPAFTSLVSGN
jgi:serine/threonine protein kinase/tetratricopeptide (TPR) repeat protein/TolB-like protein